MQSFWQTLPNPFFVLAPMADVTDPAYRKVLAAHGKPDVTWTEFVSADGLYHTHGKGKLPDAENPLLRDLQFTEAERPIVAQLFGGTPTAMEYAAKLCKELGYDGIDINMGCPDRSIEKQKCGAAMIKHPQLAAEIIAAAKTAGLPVSVKTRIGYNKESIDEWIPFLFAQDIAALTVHLRTRAEMSKVPAHWNLMPRIVALRDTLAPHTRILGNGDVLSIKEAREKTELYGCDGVMLGRAIFGNADLFSGKDPAEVTPKERLTALAELAFAFDALRPRKSFHILKKHIKAFVVGFDGAAELRATLMELSDYDALRAEIDAAISLLY